VIGSLLGGWIPPAVRTVLPVSLRPDLLHAYQITLLVGAGFVLAAVLPLLRLRGLVEVPPAPEAGAASPRAWRLLLPVSVTFLLVGMGAGLIIPFMNLYFANRFGSTSGEIGLYFSVAQIFTGAASLLGPALARRFGKLRTAIASELLSLPFLVTLGAESHLSIAVVAFLLRATLMQASTPLLNAFLMETLPPELRARCSSLSNLVWNIGWAVSATLAGAIIQRFGYAVPFYITAVLYATSAVSFYLSFRGTPEHGLEPRPAEEAEGKRGQAPFTE
jgi:MFS family permease